MTTAYINRIAAVVPDHDLHNPFVEFAAEMLEDVRAQAIFRRMAARADIDHRFSCLSIDVAAQFYRRGNFPNTAIRMQMFEQYAPELARRALDRLALNEAETRSITHVLVTSCTGLYAPGLDFEIIDHLGLDPSVERTMVGFMGCYAAINALKLARHIVRSEPKAGVLLLNLELCTLHFQETQKLDQILSFLIFADGCAATLVTSNESGLAMDRFRAVLIPGTKDLITWNIRELGFDMLLSGRVPGEIGQSLRNKRDEIVGCNGPESIPLWAVHPGGRTVLDAVEMALELPASALAASRDVLAQCGNMSSATVMFVLERTMAQAEAGQRGCAMSFGPGLTAETLLFRAV